MASERDDVLSLCDNSEDSFSGFSPLSSDDNSKKKSKPKKKSNTKKVEPAKRTKSSKPKPCNSKQKNAGESSGLDLNKLTSDDVSKLRDMLGIPMQEETYFEEEYDAIPLNERPGLNIEIENDHYSSSVRTQSLTSALFEGDTQEDDWDLPRLKTPEMGKPVGQSLARLINTSCTVPCDIDSLVKVHSIPENCDKVGPPRVNPEVWKILDKRVQSQDRALADVQSLIAASMTPVIKLAEVLKPQISSNTEAKKLLSDTITLLGQSQYNLSLRRRYALRPSLKKKYHSLCNVSMPITNQLFGDEVSKEIKALDSLQSIGKDSYNYRPQVFRGRGRFPRRPYSSYGQRYQPYPARGQVRFQSASRGFHNPRRAPTATVTAPNEKA